MRVQDLSRDQLIELKQNYLTFTQESVSYDDLASADDIVSDHTVFAYYDGVDFVNDDFACSAGEDEEECFGLDIDCHGTRSDIASDLRQIADAIEDDYYSGMANYGTSWGLDQE